MTESEKLDDEMMCGCCCCRYVHLIFYMFPIMFIMAVYRFFFTANPLFFAGVMLFSGLVTFKLFQSEIIYFNYKKIVERCQKHKNE